MFKLPLRAVALAFFLFATLTFTGAVPAIATLVLPEGCGSCCQSDQAPAIPEDTAPCSEADCPCVFCLSFEQPVGFVFLLHLLPDPDPATPPSPLSLRDMVFPIDYPPEIG
jgi:hypothetical protein